INCKIRKQNESINFHIAKFQQSLKRCPLSSSSGSGPQKNKKDRKQAVARVCEDSGYQQPTVSSRTRALSPYTHRKMCQLSEDARQRLHHLQLGPHHFRKETESQPPFLVRYINSSKVKAVSRCSNVSWMETPSSSALHGSLHRRSVSFSADHTGKPTPETCHTYS
uniref:Uncharacterized protein n=1 Tax=Stegastes partitus TaxID=144197 RepID=A0A3B5B8M2_9TELE